MILFWLHCNDLPAWSCFSSRRTYIGISLCSNRFIAKLILLIQNQICKDSYKQNFWEWCRVSRRIATAVSNHEAL